MGYGERLSETVNEITTGENGARNVEDEPRREITAAQLRGMNRGILNSGVIENAPDYKKVRGSASVKSLIRHIDNYEAAMKRMRIPHEASTDQEFMNEMAQVNGEVFAYMQEMQSYLIRKAQGYAKKGKKYAGVMGVCAAAATNIRTQMDWVNKIQENCFYALRKGLGVPYGAKYEDLMKTVNFYQETEDTERNFLGQGGISTVYTVADAERGETRVLKEGHMNMKMSGGTGDSVYERIRMKKPSNGTTHTMNTAYRDVAVSMIDKLFNLNAVVDTSMARTKSGNQASLMDKARGKEVNSTYAYMDEKGKSRAELLQQITLNRVYLQNGLDYQFKNKKEADDEMKNRKDTESRQFVNINSSQFLESTYNLAALDIIVGHVDRHAGNIMMTEAGVKGIDNDSAFSLRKAGHILGGETKNMTAQQFKSITKQDNAEGESVEVINAQGQAELFFDKAFPVVTEGFRNKILDVSLSAVEGTLKGLIMDDEIQACVNRVETLQKYLKSLPDDKIVGSFEEIDRENYANERQVTTGNMFNTNIMSQVRSVGKEIYFELDKEDIKQASIIPSGYNELTIMRDFVKRILGISSNNEAMSIVFHLMKIMAKEAENGGFNVLHALKSGQLSAMCKMAENEVIWEKEKQAKEK